MKRFLLTIAAAACLLSGCKDFDFEAVRGDKERAELKAEYNDAFTAVFGSYGRLDIDSVHSWGFNEMPTRDEVSRAHAATRAGGSFNYYKVQDGIDKLPQEYQATVPQPISDQERRYVLQYIHDNPDEGGVDFGYSTYFIQNIGSSSDKYAGPTMKDYNGAQHDVTGGNHMDYWEIDGHHINDFNAVWGPDALIENLPFQNPAYHDSWGDVNPTKTDAWRLYYISGYGYYLCFDYRTKKNSGEYYDGDGVYNDWVIKIIPANGDRGDESTMRVFAEDLGTIGDFDFNDVVFDVDYLGNGRAKITVQAAGGKMPLYVANHEVHELFGVDTEVMVNTGAQHPEGIVLASRSFEVDGLTSTNPIDIPIVVHKDGMTYAIDASTGQAPGKICVPTTTAWARERVNIKDAYTDFPRWIEDQSFKFWHGNKVISKLYYLVDTPADEKPAVSTDNLDFGAKTSFMFAGQKASLKVSDILSQTSASTVVITYVIANPYESSLGNLLFSPDGTNLDWNQKVENFIEIHGAIESGSLYYSQVRIDRSVLESAPENNPYLLGFLYNGKLTDVYVK